MTQTGPDRTEPHTNHTGQADRCGTVEQHTAALLARLDPWRPAGPDLPTALDHLRDLAHDPATAHLTAAALCIVLAEHTAQTEPSTR